MTSLLQHYQLEEQLECRAVLEHLERIADQHPRSKSCYGLGLRSPMTVLPSTDKFTLKVILCWHQMFPFRCQYS